jgi:hypothetical protein
MLVAFGTQLAAIEASTAQIALDVLYLRTKQEEAVECTKSVAS